MFPRTHPSLLVNLSLVPSTQKSIIASCLQLSLFVICPTHIISASPFNSPLSLFIILVKIRPDVLSPSLFSFFFYLSHCFVCHLLPLSRSSRFFLTRLFLSPFRQPMQISWILCIILNLLYFSLLLPITSFPLHFLPLSLSLSSLSLIRLPGAACTLSLLAAPT